ncbi:MAG TPA: GNAT family N-acetyltransferase [Pirellulaceae bacterium]|nr:GNAT family N-acetyltransferase [Pirellulaceae bacterium]
MSLAIHKVDWNHPTDRAALVELLNLYASDPMGGSQPLPDEVRQTLCDKLAAFPTCHALLAFDAETPVGLLIAFVGFSTFKARPLLNLHDVAVRPGRRGQGIGRQLLASAEALASELGCCKMTLEVHDRNPIAQHLYQSYGFRAFDPPQAFWMKAIDDR